MIGVIIMQIIREARSLHTVQDNKSFESTCGCDHAECSCDSDTLLPEEK